MMSEEADSVVGCTVSAPINIALIKYWGKRDVPLNLPCNGSISMTLGQEVLKTITTVTIERSCSENIVSFKLNGKQVTRAEELYKVQLVIQKVRELSETVAVCPFKAHNAISISISSENNFPTGAGLASSASGFAALVFALAKLFRLDSVYSWESLSAIARMGSGSACRSLLLDNCRFVKWDCGTLPDGSDSIARGIPISHADNGDWRRNLQLLICIVSGKSKKVPSTGGMQRTVATSKLFPIRVESVVPDRLVQLERLISVGNGSASEYEEFCRLVMMDSNQFHACCLDSYPPIQYLNDTSRSIINLVHEYNNNLSINNNLNVNYQFDMVAYTFDAGPNAVLLFSHTRSLLNFLKYCTNNGSISCGGEGKSIDPSVQAALKELNLNASLSDKSRADAECTVQDLIHTSVSDTGPHILH